MTENRIIVLCAKCQSKNRVPANHGKIEVTCGRCGEKFVAWSGEKLASNNKGAGGAQSEGTGNANRAGARAARRETNLTPKQKKWLIIAAVFVGALIIGICVSALADRNSTAYNINRGVGEYIDYSKQKMQTQQAQDTLNTLNSLGLPYGELKY